MGILDWHWSLMDWVLALTTALGVLYYLRRRSGNRFSKYNIPHIKSSFMSNLGKNVSKSFHYQVLDIYNDLKEHQYGGCFLFNMPFFFINDPELIKTLAVKDFEYFTDHRPITEDLPGKEAIWTKGVFSLRENEMMVLELKEFFTRYTNDVIATTAFGIGVDSLKQPKNEFFLMELEDDDIVAQALIFFLAGFDTSSSLLCFVCYMLATHSEVQKRLQGEVDRTLEENDGKFTYEIVNNMKYLDIVVSETLRMYPPVAAIDRICNRNYTLKTDPPCEFFPGDFIYFPVFGLHYDPKYYPEPEKFDPERFSDDNKHNINPFTYLPFGIGPRSCLGNRFALMETKLVLAYMLTKFNIRTVSKTPESLKFAQKGFNLTIEGGFWVGLEMRKS
ncbi:Cytochrome P450 9e2 [Blattella germanica]|nr:Cytochrome P450 9e2 [Blattella germanica]